MKCGKAAQVIMSPAFDGYKHIRFFQKWYQTLRIPVWNSAVAGAMKNRNGRRNILQVLPSRQL
jgi:hypothetical protein